MRSEAVMTLPRLRVVRPGERSPEAARAQAERSLRRVVTALILSVLCLTTLGLVMVLSASSISAFQEFGSSFRFFERQLIYAGVGALLAFGVSRIRHVVWQKAWAPLLAVTGVLLILVLHPSVGTTAGGAARWISAGPVTIQPSEVAKFVVIAAAAAILARHLGSLNTSLGWVVPLAVIVGGVSLLILVQPDLGTAAVVGLTVLFMLFVAGVRLRLLLWSALLSGGMGMALILGEQYRRARFFSFLDPWADPRNTGYQIVQSLIALGSGHLLGMGLGASRQKWAYVPNAHTDFIFSILGEELGLVGEVVVLILFGVLVYAGMRIALKAPDPFGRLLAAGITTWLGLQAVINLGAVTGVLPITGVPLPFLSYGGSALVVSMVAVGVLVSIGRASVAELSGAGHGRRKRARAPG